MRWRLKVQLRQVKYEGAGTHRPHAWHTPPQLLTLSPDWTGAQPGVQVIVEGREASMKPRDMGLDISLETARRAPEAVLCGRPPGDEWPTPRQQGAQLFRLRAGQGTPRGPHGLGNMRQGAGREDIRLGQWPRGCGEVTRLAGIDHDEG